MPRKHINQNSHIQAVNADQQHNFWSLHQTYVFEDKDGIFFSCKNTSKKTPGYNLIYFSPQNLIGKGEFGSVYSAQVYAIDEKTKACTLKDKKKVVKDYSKGNQISTINQIQKEFQLTSKAKHLGVKAPVFHNKHSFFVMNELPGEDFIDLLENRVIESLSRQQKVRLTKELLVALNTQVISKGLVHRDIKPENIRIQLQPEIKVNIFDFGLAKNQHQIDGIFPGSPVYAAPEIFLHEDNHDSPGDIFSMGRTLSLLWLDDDELNDHFGFEGWESANNARNNFRLKNEPDIEPLILSMLSLNPKDRPTIDHLINEINTIEATAAHSNIPLTASCAIH